MNSPVVEIVFSSVRDREVFRAKLQLSMDPIDSLETRNQDPFFSGLHYSILGIHVKLSTQEQPSSPMTIGQISREYAEIKRHSEQLLATLENTQERKEDGSQPRDPSSPVTQRHNPEKVA